MLHRGVIVLFDRGVIMLYRGVIMLLVYRGITMLYRQVLMVDRHGVMPYTAVPMW